MGENREFSIGNAIELSRLGFNYTCDRPPSYVLKEK